METMKTREDRIEDLRLALQAAQIPEATIKMMLSPDAVSRLTDADLEKQIAQFNALQTKTAAHADRKKRLGQDTTDFADSLGEAAQKILDSFWDEEGKTWKEQ